MNVGPQYSKDDCFKRLARLHQSNYRAEVLRVDYDRYGSRLTYEDARQGLNYYPELGVRDEWKKRFPKYSKRREPDLLRSEHMPFNLFAPLKTDLGFAKDLFNIFLGGVMHQIQAIRFEYAPRPRRRYLNDGTSFDTYIVFTHVDGKKGAVGIEVKYTEGAYRIGPKEASFVNDKESPYWTVTEKSRLYVEDAEASLISDDFRQIWRNHILGESIKQQGEIEHFTSMIIYPSGNSHFSEVVPKYQELLRSDKKGSFRGLPLDSFVEQLRNLGASPELERWIDYLDERYLVRPEVG